MKIFLKKIASDKFIKNNFIFFTGSMIVAFLNYIYHPALGRIMDVESFGEVQVIISIFLFLAIFGGVFKNIVVNLVANIEDKAEREKLILMLGKFAYYFFIIISFLLIIFSGELKEKLKFDSFWPFIVLASLLFLGNFFNIRQAILQGLNKFSEISIANIIMSAGRLIFAVILVYIGWSSFGAIMGMLIAQTIAFFYVLLKTKDHLGLNRNKKIKINDKIKKELIYGILILAGTLCITFLYTFDVIIVKYYFPADEAGLYSGIATIARIIFFITGSISAVLLPAIKINDKKNENLKILLKALFLIVAIGGAVLLTFFLFYNTVVNTLIGEKYLSFAGFLPNLSILLFFVSIINILFFYLFALRNRLLFFPAIFAPLIVTILSFFNHQSINNIINNFILGSVLILISLLFIIYLEICKSKKKHGKEADINNNSGI
ncbi:oligosaccharide flippase family protein [Candidatus Parcubacteria bacterium]|nr:oligosaccharide flippase family protein [Candidatus Parcubacteria bacterium]